MAQGFGPGQAAGVPGWVVVLMFGCQVLVGVSVFLMAYLGSTGKLRRNAFFGVRTSLSLSSDAAWRRVHRQAAPFAYAAAGLVVVGLVAMALTTASNAGFLISLLVTDFLVVVLIGAAVLRSHRDAPKA